MPMPIELKTEGLSERLQVVLGLPDFFARARRSALSSTGANVMVELRNHIEYGGSGWPALHPITLRLRKFSSATNSPVFYLGRFSRYLVNKDGTMLEIGFGKSHRGEPGQIDDPWLTAVAARAEHGQIVRVSKKTRLVWLNIKEKVKGKLDTRSGAAMRSYFALRPSTTTLTIPKRPIFDPVYRKVAPKVTPHFEAVFWANLERYESGAAKSTKDMEYMGWRS